MTRSARISHIARAVAALALLGTLAGCDTLNDWLAPDRVDYRSATSAPTLTVPEDLSKAHLDDHFTVPATQIGLGGAPLFTQTANGTATLGQPTAQDPLGMHIERDGDTRRLVVDGRTPEELWSELKEFWGENGFVVETDLPAQGLLETNWAENRAKIGNDWFRASIGKLFDGIYSSGTLDKFRMVVEKGPNGETEITISHSALEEVMIGQQKETSRWVSRPRDPNLEVALLNRLMQKFGLSNTQALMLEANAQPGDPKVSTVSDGGTPELDVAEPFDRAWLRIGVALDRSSFAVDNSDKSKGLYYVRYVDDTQDIKKEGLFGKLLTSNAQPKKLVVNVRPKNDALTQVTVVDASGNFDTSAEAKRLVSTLSAALN
ncbi:outer membrane protein assembly factor BamC [Pararobbsia silviterrae]|uniref:Outer membrane protein assembly factor BamC n=1 Tax=Pararobbsia silviterrae TaxID=1792498 RepID=A0A494XGD2_9BURK|nr:outer membrane protein assembly factor BamC [Pararobbsia silviterrae]RKP46653.1 outer membrane protein assembly factor BamC [Pararobbsia silviterrae]